MPIFDTLRPDDLIAIGSRVRVNSAIGSSWNGQRGSVTGYRGNPADPGFRYWVDMPILHPVIGQPITIDGEPQSLPQMFRRDELVLEPDTPIVVEIPV